MKRIFIIFHGRFPSEKAASLFAAKSAESFSDENVPVTLLVPRRKGVSEERHDAYYGVKNNFDVVYLPTLDLFGARYFSKFAFLISLCAFSLSTFFYLRKRAGNGDVLYSNETIPLWISSFKFKNTFYEMHDFPESKKTMFGMFIRRMRWVLIHNQWKTQEATKQFRLDEKRVITVPNAVDLSSFGKNMPKAEARNRLNLPAGSTLVVYTGHLYAWKGTDTLALAAYQLPDIQFIFVGGTEKDASYFKEKYQQKNIQFVGFRPHKEIPYWQSAADVLVLPNSGKELISTHYTSPMKLFEYMASYRPIVASNLPSIREITGDDSAILVEPDNPLRLAEGIQKALKSDVSKPLVEIARRKVEDNTWQKRARRIINFIQKDIV